MRLNKGNYFEGLGVLELRPVVDIAQSPRSSRKIPWDYLGHTVLFETHITAISNPHIALLDGRVCVPHAASPDASAKLTPGEQSKPMLRIAYTKSLEASP